MRTFLVYLSVYLAFVTQSSPSPIQENVAIAKAEGEERVVSAGDLIVNIPTPVQAMDDYGGAETLVSLPSRVIEVADKQGTPTSVSRKRSMTFWTSCAEKGWQLPHNKMSIKSLKLRHLYPKAKSESHPSVKPKEYDWRRPHRTGTRPTLKPSPFFRRSARAAI
ncbi:hypothetical protein M422DRAFT_260208 [Sphaerobolus stellatus SS14]|uniref:Uncharacterized protein n=1 Tax=Sphaerobolus stellatus (strain SS14) TaxID=990650 RepID=A0A0C9V6S8_SPHS4|nr:hypothetical protein M422DRAFT_260208 [Sphaerobolus stellatus SS14]